MERISIATLSRLNLAYMLSGGIIARLYIEPKFINFDEPELVGQSLILLGSLTSLIAGLFIALQLHIYLNNFLLGLAGRFHLTNYHDYKKEVSKKKEFSSTLEEFNGNSLILLILFFMFMSYSIELLLPNLGNPLKVFKPPLMRSNIYLTTFLGLFLLFMVLTTIKSFNAWRKRLNFYMHHQYYQENKELLNEEQNADVQEQKNWLNEYRKLFSTNWDQTEELYLNRKYALQLILENVIEFLEDFPKEYKKLSSLKNIRKYAQLEHKDLVRKQETYKPITTFWKFWKQSPSSLSNIRVNAFKLRTWGIMAMIDVTLANKFLDFYDRVNSVATIHSEMSRKMDKLSANAFDYGLQENEKKQLGGNVEQVFKQIYLIEQFPEYMTFIEDFFNLHNKEANIYVQIFKPATQNAKHKFLELEEEEILPMVVEESFSIRKMYEELLKNLCDNVTKDLNMLNKCLEELKSK